MAVRRSKSKLSGATLPGVSGVTTGSYTNTDLTVLPDGTVSAAANGTAGGGGGWTLITTKTASTSASLDFTSVINSTYNTYVFVLNNLMNATTAHKLQMLLSSDNGSTWISTNYYNANSYMTNSGGPAADNSGPVGAFNLGLNQDNSLTEGLSGEVWLFNPLFNASRFDMRGATVHSAAGAFVSYIIGGTQVSTAAFNAVQFKYDTGNIASGNIYLFGIQK